MPSEARDRWRKCHVHLGDDPGLPLRPVACGKGQVIGSNDADIALNFEQINNEAPEEVGGNVSVGSFNVLNYFTTTGDQLEGCTYYRDREGNPLTVRQGCDARGAANAENFNQLTVQDCFGVEQVHRGRSGSGRN